MIQIKQIHSSGAPSTETLKNNNITESDVLIVDDNGTLYVTYLVSGEPMVRPIKAVYNNGGTAIGSTTQPVYVDASGQVQQCGTINKAANADNATNADKATIAEKLGTSNVGATNQLIYLNSGTPAGGIKILAGTQEPSSLSSDIPNGSIYIKYSN